MFNPVVTQMLARFERERLERNLARAAQAREIRPHVRRDDQAGRTSTWIARVRGLGLRRYAIAGNASQPACSADGAC